MAEVEPVNSVDSFSLTILEQYAKLLPVVSIEVRTWPRHELAGRWDARANELGEVGKLAEQAMWAWISSGLIGLQAYLMSRPDVWVQLA